MSKGINNLKNSTIDSFESMQKLFEYMEVLQEDSLKTDLFQTYLNKYKDFFCLNTYGDLVPFISDPNLMMRINSIGFIVVGDNCFSFKKDRIIVYSFVENKYKFNRVENRQMSSMVHFRVRLNS